MDAKAAKANANGSFDLTLCVMLASLVAACTSRIIGPQTAGTPQHRLALYDAISPAEARRRLRRLRFHFTPKHGSWLLMVEIEISILSRWCLKQRIDFIETLQQLASTWQQWRNAQRATINWCFEVSRARTKPGRLCP
jgi:hypothetical protein